MISAKKARKLAKEVKKGGLNQKALIEMQEKEQSRLLIQTVGNAVRQSILNMKVKNEIELILTPKEEKILIPELEKLGYNVAFKYPAKHEEGLPTKKYMISWAKKEAVKPKSTTRKGECI